MLLRTRLTFTLTAVAASAFLVFGSGVASASTPAGQAFSWGTGAQGALGNGSTSNQTTPVAVTTTGVLAGKTVVQVSGGGMHACALTSDGLVACWGYNANGQLGDGTTSASSVPVSVTTTGALAGKTIVEVQAGSDFSCSRASDGTVACWSGNFWGQLGDGTNNDSTVPVAVTTSGASALNGRAVTSLALGYGTTCALLDNGGGSCWGAGNRGTLGNGIAGNVNVPAAISMSGVFAGLRLQSISVGALHACATTTSGVLACWGLNADGQLGTGATSADELSPVAVDMSGVLAGQTMTTVGAGGNATCAATQAGWAACWGENAAGNVGNGTSGAAVVSPARVDTSTALDGKTVTSISLSYEHTCALTSVGLVACWGNGSVGALGDGTTITALAPVAVDQSGVLRGLVVTSIATGDYSTYAVAAPSTDQADQRPPDRVQQLPRQADESCDRVDDSGLEWGTGLTGGWGPSWAEWVNGGTGGFVCNRTLTYAQNLAWRTA